ncbi:EAL domain-containing protein [Anoxybacteroides amylolyticum]|uniref:Diguanylate cyclase domain protein n=1 Tax=Anoxybacteroides amylolyticum TaxID=294699 RepID=A0A161HYW9_9BACL|nr:EAL domain-containing protein [Anoxybacillus amylolyticus]ANB61830.1 diguanylate cyclase domain protein [Anoxybacillus amylolyticus]
MHQSPYVPFYFWMPAMQFILDIDGFILDVNEFAARYLGYRRDELIGKHALIVVHPRDKEKVNEQISKLHDYELGRIYSFEFRKMKKNGEIVYVQENMCRATTEDGHTIFLASCHNISAEKKAKELLAGQKKILELIAKEMPLVDILTEITHTVEQIRPEIVCSILLLNEDTNRLYHGAAPSLPQDYVEAINGFCVGPDVGSCGAAAFRQELVVVANIETDPLWQNYKEVALKYGLRACWSVPIFSSKKIVLGTFGIYHYTSCEPNEEDMEIIYTFSSLAGLAIEQAKIKEELQESRQHYQSLFEYNQDAVFSLHSDGTFFAVNRAAAQMTGYPRHELLKMSLHDLVVPDDLPKILEALIDTSEGYARHLDFRIRHKKGTFLYVSATPVPIWINKSVIGVSIIAKDVTERVEQDKRIQQLAYYDPLTGLANRRLFYDNVWKWVTKAKQTKKTVALLYMDIDRFKYVNDSLGHSIGDRILQAVASLIQEKVAEKGTVARMSGDEFTVVLPNLDYQHEAIDVAKSILRTFQEPIRIGELDLFLTSSIGIAFYPHHSDDVDTLIQYADMAMYEVKRKGKNDYFVYEPRLLEQKLPNLILLNDLHKSIQNNELSVVYQPIVDVQTRNVQAMETLVRWYHPVHGQVSPGQFISLAEETGFIVSIGEWVLRQACEQHKMWCELGLPPIRIAVNISVKELLDPHFAKRIEWILEEKQMSPQCLELEITESMMIYNESVILANLQRMKEMGVRLAIDDFGTGYSSLAYVKRLEVDTVKIDQSFIADCPHSYYGSVITNTIISLAHHLGMNVIAEGVENLEQLRYLEEKGCQEAQGYLFSVPLRAEEATRLLFHGIRHLT